MTGRGHHHWCDCASQANENYFRSFLNLFFTFYLLGDVQADVQVSLCRHIAGTLPAHCRHIEKQRKPSFLKVFHLPAHRRHIAGTLPAHCRHIAGTLPAHPPKDKK
jgi:hypothetical protein